jgi:ribosomal protein S18 acetylase RimI-like enzyme
LSHVRPGTPEDAAAIARVQDRGWRVAYAHVFPPEALAALAIDAGRWRARLTAPPHGWATFVADGDGGVAGFVAVGPSRDDDAVGEVYAIYVDPDRWGDGVGRALLERGVEALTTRGFREATLWVLEDNPRARRFYEAAGWAADGARKHEPYLGVDVAEVRYRRSLA